MKTLACMLFIFFFPLRLYSIDYIIFSVDQDLPMGFDQEVVRKNYYLNFGANQGIKNGTTIDVYRSLSLSNPYDRESRVNYSVKIGELKIIHTEENASVGVQTLLLNTPEDVVFEVGNFMVGDKVTVQVK